MRVACSWSVVVGWLVVGLADPGAVARAQTPGGGRLVIPPPTRTIAVADLAGEWGYDDGISERYVDRTTGAYAGSDTLRFREKWLITAKGAISLDFFAIQNGRKIVQKSAGVVSLSADRIMVIRMTNEQKYLVRGWLDTPTMTVMKLNGPWYADGIPADIISNPAQGTNLDLQWVRLKAH
jgi:hypothetical protein